MHKIFSAIKIRVNLLKCLVKFSFQKETVSLSNNIAGVISTLAYTVVFLLFLDVLFGKITNFAGYDKNQILFFTFITQMQYYLTWLFSTNNFNALHESINSGKLDQILIKPVPSLFYSSIQNIRIISFLFSSIPPQVAIVSSINWSVLQISSYNLILGSIIFILGIYLIHVSIFLLTVPSFWTGQGEQIIKLLSTLQSSNHTYESMNIFLRTTYIYFLPIGIGSMLAVSVYLNKFDPNIGLALTIVLSIIFSIIRIKMWKFCLRNYTSASS